jgi:DNA-3-methyladenine glycosylase II
LTVEFCVALREELNVGGSLELFRRSGDDFIDRWDGQRLVRAVYTRDHTFVPFMATLVPDSHPPVFRVAVTKRSHIDEVRHAVATTLTPAPPDYVRLLREDSRLATLDSLNPGIRQIRQLDLFTALIRCISAQQVNLRWAAITRRRLAEAFGRRYDIAGEVVYALDPERIARVDPTEIRALQFTNSKAVSIVATARAITQEPDLSVERLHTLEDEQIIERLARIRGIGRWSAEWVLARTLGRPRVVAGDLGVRKAVGLAYLSEPLPSEADVRLATEHWRQSAGVAQAVLLHALAEKLLTPPVPNGSPAVSRGSSSRWGTGGAST